MNISENQRPKKPKPLRQSNQNSLRRNWAPILIFMAAAIALYSFIAWSGNKSADLGKANVSKSSDHNLPKTAQNASPKSQQTSQASSHRIVELTGVLLTAYQKYAHLLNSDVTDKYGNTYTIRKLIIRSFREYTCHKKTGPVYPQGEVIRVFRTLWVLKAHAARCKGQRVAGGKERATRSSILWRRRRGL